MLWVVTNRTAGPGVIVATNAIEEKMSQLCISISVTYLFLNGKELANTEYSSPETVHLFEKINT